MPRTTAQWIGPVLGPISLVVLTPLVRQRLTPFLAKPSKEDLVALRDMIEAGRVTPVIDRTYPLKEVPEALRYLEEGHARGKVVITM